MARVAMTDSTWLLLSLLVLLGWLWSDNLRAREVAVSACRAACRRGGVQLLDDTVALKTMTLQRCQGRGLCIRRVYQFELSQDGNNRLQGLVTLRGTHVVQLHLPSPPLHLI
jgi:hypothetical protein